MSCVKGNDLKFVIFSLQIHVNKSRKKRIIPQKYPPTPPPPPPPPKKKKSTELWSLVCKYCFTRKPTKAKNIMFHCRSCMNLTAFWLSGWFATRFTVCSFEYDIGMIFGWIWVWLRQGLNLQEFGESVSLTLHCHRQNTSAFRQAVIPTLFCCSANCREQKCWTVSKNHNFDA